MGNYDDRVTAPLDLITGPMVGENLLEAIKDAMVQENVFKALFGANGERIYVDKIPSYNDTIVPLIEFYWGRERPETWDTRQSGSINVRIVLPPRLGGNTNDQRRVATAFQRFIAGDAHNLFETVPGLIEIGVGAEYAYDQTLHVSGLALPVIPVTLPYTFDLKLLQQLTPEIDFRDRLDAPEIGFIETYRIQIVNEEQTVLIPEGVLFETGETNEG